MGGGGVEKWVSKLTSANVKVKVRGEAWQFLTKFPIFRVGYWPPIYISEPFGSAKRLLVELIHCTRVCLV